MNVVTNGLIVSVPLSVESEGADAIAAHVAAELARHAAGETTLPTAPVDPTPAE